MISIFEKNAVYLSWGFKLQIYCLKIVYKTCKVDCEASSHNLFKSLEFAS